MTNRTPWRLLTVVALAVLVAAGCASDAPYDTLEPQGGPARSIDSLFNLVWWVATAVFVLVMGAVVYVSMRYRARRNDDGDWDDDEELPEQVHGNTRLELGWTIAPAVVLAVIAVPTLVGVFELAEWHEDAEVEIEVFGAQWWWEFRYPGTDVVTANTIVFPAGEPIELTMTSYDVLHSFWLPALNGKRDVAPGRTHTWSIEADEPGVYWGQCVEFCGLSHANMRIRGVALAPEEYEAWLVEQNQVQAQGGPEADDSYLQTARWDLTRGVTPADAQAGFEVFGQICSSCHVVSGQYEAAAGGIAPLVSGHAPDLTHFMTRTGFAANIYDLYNDDGSVNVAELRQWVWNAPSLKGMAPDDQRGMPGFTEQLTREQVDDIVAYLMTLGGEPTLPSGTTLEDADILRRD